MLQIKNLSKTFYQRNDEKKVLNGISLTVKKGQVFGFLGLNGEGKTTTVKAIVDLIFPDAGTIKIGAFDHDSSAAKNIIGFMPETPQFYLYQNASEVLRYVGGLFELDEKTIKERSKRLLKDVGLADAAKTPVRKFSKGMTQRLGFAVALMNDPELLILDEPLDGLDPVGRIDFKRLINRLRAEKKTVFFSTHILSDVEELCDEVAILDRSKILIQGSPKKLIGSSKKTLEEVFVEMVNTKIVAKTKAKR